MVDMAGKCLNHILLIFRNPIPLWPYAESLVVFSKLLVKFFQCCGSGMFIPDPNFFLPGSASNSLTQKFGLWTLGNMIRVVHTGSGSCFFTHPGSRGQKGNGSRIRIRNTAFFNNLRCEAVMLFYKSGQFRIFYTVGCLCCESGPGLIWEWAGSGFRIRVQKGKKIIKIKNELRNSQRELQR